MTSFEITKKNQLTSSYNELQTLYAQQDAFEKGYLKGQEEAYLKLKKELQKKQKILENDFKKILEDLCEHIKDIINKEEVDVEKFYIERVWESLKITAQIPEIKDSLYFKIFNSLIDIQTKMNNDILFHLSDEKYTPCEKLIAEL